MGVDRDGGKTRQEIFFFFLVRESVCSDRQVAVLSPDVEAVVAIFVHTKEVFHVDVRRRCAQRTECLFFRREYRDVLPGENP